ncbi:MAG: hypothetical protein KAI43_03985 [Candidatus Aureabacteria bacterium]|nr:hypothetical protein [Candidatus Auribacterota bacterium]
MKKTLLLKSIFMMIFFICIADSCFADKEPLIFVIKSRDQKPHEFLKRSVLDNLKSEKISFKSKIFEMNSDFKKAKDILKKIEKEKPDLVLSIGSESTLFFSLYTKNIPIIFSMVYKSDKIATVLEKTQNVKGIFINLDMEIVFNVLKDIKPNLKKIGIMSPSKHFNDQMDHLTKSAEKNEIEIISREVNSASDVPRAINELTKAVDALYVLPSPIFTNRQMLKRIILKTLSNNIFVAGGSFEIVERGGLIGFGFDINNTALITTNMVKEFLKTKDINGLESRRCNKFYLYLNKRTSSSIGIKFSKKIESMAVNIIE